MASQRVASVSFWDLTCPGQIVDRVRSKLDLRRAAF